MLLVALISLITTRYVLQYLGVDDFGLYNVVAGVVAMLNFLSIAMITTTRRFVNVEMGRKDGKLNNVFNTCFQVHVAFAICIYIVALTVGLWYVNNILNVSPDKLIDARFVFLISTTICVLGIINVPFQALIIAYERFTQSAIIDFSTSCLRIPLVIGLAYNNGNNLRFYAIGMCIISLISFILYTWYCRYNFREVIKLNLKFDKPLFKEVLLFNNYTSLGAFAYMGRSQGSVMILNYFFGTAVNAAYAIANTVEGQINNLVSNLTVASNPQITQEYSAGNYDRSYTLVQSISKYSILIMLLICSCFYVELESILQFWLQDVPVGAATFCALMMFSLFVRSLNVGIDGLINATGKVKWFQISVSFLMIIGIPLSIALFYFGLPAYTIIIVFSTLDFCKLIVMLAILKRVSTFSISSFVKESYFPVLKVLCILLLYIFTYKYLLPDKSINWLVGVSITFIFVILVEYAIALTSKEREVLKNRVFNKVLSSIKK